MKTCTKCEIEYPHTEFEVRDNYLRSCCRLCKNKQTKLSRHNLWKRHPEKYEQYKADQNERRKKRVVEKKNYDKEKYLENRDKVLEGRKKYYHKNFEHCRMVRYTRQYKMSKEQYWELRKLENCQCCGNHKSKFKKGLFIDHDHNTGKVRGLICCHCNSVAGFAMDNKDRLKLVDKYLTNTSSLT